MSRSEATKLLKRSSLKLWCLLSLLGLLQLSSKVRTLPSKLADAPQDLAGASVAEAAGHASEAERRVAVPDGVSAGAGLPPAELAQSPAGLEHLGVERSVHKRPRGVILSLRFLDLRFLGVRDACDEHAREHHRRDGLLVGGHRRCRCCCRFGLVRLRIASKRCVAIVPMYSALIP